MIEKENIINIENEVQNSETTINMDGLKIQNETDKDKITKAEDDVLVINLEKLEDEIKERRTNINVYRNGPNQVYWAQQGNYPPPGYQQQPPPPQQGYPVQQQGYPVQQQGYPPPQPPPEHHNGYFSVNYPEDHNYVPYDPETRNKFIRLVFFILLVMLAVTAVLIYVFITMDPFRQFFRRLGFGVSFIFIFALMGVSMVMGCLPMARKMPCNIIMLVVAVILYSMFSAKICVRYKTNILILAVIITMVFVLLCLCLAMTKFDFTSYMLYIIGISLVVSLLCLSVVVMMYVMKIRLKGLIIAILFISVILQTVMLIMELQMVLGGKSVELEEDDYAYGAYSLYSSVVSLFLNLVMLIGALD